ncbi:hypothetical protein BX616_000313 [Lobosporangium transversale]|uniref:Actin-like ATPase domain-containing protein n=1 Tax=Lobosporangium transversale TaxID=64571 RepID=A0A1Y2GVS3_9FUNG|nr:hypothetical protein BCR41DRAFT_348200 [Lobosporangium transversale]KAF9907836.1 hypothetical protein BX616_000313 [Lobosporangium transversale]ORZ26388.1 hypothetical protein BCR41DRAFT_348200 [Lobosporangium transversale]|eukprot:XP_021884153.1 hypothetical protein BCR41DRAFT_348200 [Lobosporangium transversale]
MKKLFGGKSSKDKKPAGSSTPPTPAHAQVQSPSHHQQRPTNGQPPSASGGAAAQPAPTAMVFTSLASAGPPATSQGGGMPPQPHHSHLNGTNGYGGGGGGYPPVSTPGSGYSYNQHQPYPGMPQPHVHGPPGGIVPPPSSNPMYPPVRPIPPPSSNTYQSQPYNPNYAPGSGAAVSNHQQQQQQPFGGLHQPSQQQHGVRANGSRLTGDPKEDYPIVMAIDFGTTFTGCAFAFRKDPEIQEIITWPKQAYQYPKVPTISLYKVDSPEFLDWGYPARAVMMTPNAKKHLLLSKFKLQLDDQQENIEPLPLGIRPLDAISDYLGKFHSHVVKEAMKNFGSTYDQSHIQYCLTVPAMWSDRAKHVMRQAAIRAGLIKEDDPAHRLIIVSEPEAAAMYCQSKGDQFNLQKHDRFLICDAGGGTVDLIVFEVVDVNPETGIRSLREVTRGHGASCGSAFLDANMEKLLREKFQKYPLTPMGWGTIMDTFVNQTKPIFPGTDPEMYLQVPNIPNLPDANDLDIGLEDGMLKLMVSELHERVFDPVVKDVLDLIEYQLSQTHCEAIFMVGGFGSSRYLFDRVTAKFATAGRQVRVPPRAELAVVRGAVTYGLHQGSIISRVARRWYGVDSAMDFVPGVDPEEKKTLSRDGTVRCKDRFSVYITPGQSVALGECVTKKYMTWCYPRPLDCPLYVSDSEQEPRYVDEPSVKKLGDFQIPMPDIPGMMPGAEVLVEVKMHFGETEVRAEALVLGQTVTAVCQWIG